MTWKGKMLRAGIEVDGDTMTIDKKLVVNSALNVLGDLDTSGDVTFEGDIAIEGDFATSGSVTADEGFFALEGDAKSFPSIYNQTLASGESFSIGTGPGLGIIAVSSAYSIFSLGAAGAVTSLTKSSNVTVGSSAAGSIAIFDSGTTTKIKNRADALSAYSFLAMVFK